MFGPSTSVGVIFLSVIVKHNWKILQNIHPDTFMALQFKSGDTCVVLLLVGIAWIALPQRFAVATRLALSRHLWKRMLRRSVH